MDVNFQIIRRDPDHCFGLRSQCVLLLGALTCRQEAYSFLASVKLVEPPAVWQSSVYFTASLSVFDSFNQYLLPLYSDGQNLTNHQVTADI